LRTQPTTIEDDMIGRVLLITVLTIVMRSIQTLSVPQMPMLPLSTPTPTELFMKKVAEIESMNDYSSVSIHGMLGKYQFSPTTIKDLGFDITAKEFLDDWVLQDSVMIRYMTINDSSLANLINRYDGILMNDMLLSRASILAGAHFAGTTGMRRYLTSGGQVSVTDRHGMHIQQYISQFSDIDLPPLTLPLMGDN
jgi:hypothetical protein